MPKTKPKNKWELTWPAGRKMNSLIREVEKPPLVHYWHSERIPDYLVEHLRTFRDLNPNLRQLVFSERSAAVFIDEHFGQRHLRAFRSCAVPAMQSDYLRYCAILALGGVYCDIDWVCLDDLSPLLPGVAEGRLVREPRGLIMNSVFAFGSPGHQLLELTLEIATTNIEQRTFSAPNLKRRILHGAHLTAGPPIFTALYQAHRQGSFEAMPLRAKGAGPIAEYTRENVLRNCCDSYASVTRAFEGILITERDESPKTYLALPSSPLPYKATSDHWMNFQGEIFREPSD